MNLPTPQQPTLKPVDPAELMQSVGVYARRRAYYNERTSRKMQPLYDQIIAAKQSFIASASDFACSPGTLVNMINGTLSWLRENSPAVEAEKYSYLRKCITLKQHDNGVLISYAEPVERNVRIMPVAIAQTSDSGGATVSWFDKFVSWATTAREFEKFDSMKTFGGVVEITSEHEAALVKFCAQLGLELNVVRAQGRFEAMK